MDIRVSTGSAVQLGLERARLDAGSRTLYTLFGERCLGDCRFCTQARSSTASRRFLSRVTWPRYPLEEVLAQVAQAGEVQRVCIQTLNAPEQLPELVEVAAQVHAVTEAALSICMNPTERRWLEALRAAGVERVGVGLDCATPESFAAMKPGFSYARYLEFVAEVAEVFGRSSVHLIAGLGDSDHALLEAFWRFSAPRRALALFAYTPVRGTRLRAAPPAVERYRALQVARALIAAGHLAPEQVRFDDGRLVRLVAPRNILARLRTTGSAFRTSGCLDCNRPLYNERPGGVTYNYPAPLTPAQAAQAWAELTRYVELVEL